MKKRREQPLPEPELLAILRAADDIIASGGRTLLSKILKGSKERKVIELELNRNPSYGFYKELTLEQIVEKIDQMLRTGYLDIEWSGKLPLIVFTPLGWMIERDRRAQEFLQEWDFWIEHNISPIMEYLKERNRGLILLFLYRILCTGNKKYLPYLNLWEQNAYKKVQVEIRHVIKALNQRETMDDQEWERLKRERAKSLLLHSEEPVFLACRKCPRTFIPESANPDYYTSEGLRLPELCPDCMEKARLKR
ncbi:RQC-minor-1 family DNA-binding protein [Paenibacillus sp. GCM10027626]|uniref:RQC-minor-1 family DNA-binding protein n=1 Tax=Paenibacillus sp. GCM10027626 TaxID=3273411 RepID=UPI00362D9872